MRLALCRYPNLHQGGMTIMEYHGQWTANKELEEEFRYKFVDSDRVTNRGCEDSRIKSSYPNHNENSADASEVAW